MKTTLNADGRIGIPDEIRQTDHLSAGDAFELERLTPGHYLLTKQPPPGGRFTVAIGEDVLPIIRAENDEPPLRQRPQRDSILTKGPSGVLDHATNEMASGSKLGIDATKKIPGEGFKRLGRRARAIRESQRDSVPKLRVACPGPPGVTVCQTSPTPKALGSGRSTRLFRRKKTATGLLANGN